MEIDNELLNSLFWFVAGAISFRLLSGLLLSGANSIIMEKALLQSLILLRFCDDSFGAILKLKSSKLHDGEAEREALQQSIEADSLTLDIWRAASINGVINHFPRASRHIIKFKDWNGAMSYLSRTLRENTG